MIRLLSDLLAGYALAPELEVTGVETDSRRVMPGDAFLAIKGVVSHGLSYVDVALDRGASAVVWEPSAGIIAPADLPVPQVPVPQLSQRVGVIAARMLGEPAKKLFTIGVTGTDGKTSTAYLVAQALDRLGIDCGYLGTIGYGRVGALRDASHTTPDAIYLQQLFADFVSDGLKACAMEVSSHALDQARVAGIGFDVSVLTNLSRDHLDYHGSVEAYAAAKKKLFTDYTRGATVLNRDDACGAAWASELIAQKADVTVYGIDGTAPDAGRYLLAHHLQLSATGLAFELESSWGNSRLECHLLGRFNVYNLLAALAVLLNKGVTLAVALQALAASHTVPGRIEGFRGSKAAPLVVVDYAHTPEALAQILTALRAHTLGKLICVFGCGGDRDVGKRPLMGAVVQRLADVAIVTDDNPRSESPAAIAADIVAGMSGSVRVIHDRAEAISLAVREAGANDVVVIAGKGHETTQTSGQDVRHFSDREFAAQLVGASQ